MARVNHLVALVLLVGACDPDDGSSDVQDPCGPSEFYDEYAPGLDKTGDRMRVSLHRATPAPPEKGDNTWELEVSDLEGNPLEGLVIEVFPFMPDHGHGTPVEPEIAMGEDAGDYVVEHLGFVMGGRWEITLSLDDGTGSPDEVIFDFCVPD